MPAGGSFSMRALKTLGGRVCCSTPRSWLGCPQTVRALAKCSTPLSRSPAASNVSPNWISWRKYCWTAEWSFKSGILRLFFCCKSSRFFLLPETKWTIKCGIEWKGLWFQCFTLRSCWWLTHIQHSNWALCLWGYYPFNWSVRVARGGLIRNYHS